MPDNRALPRSVDAPRWGREGSIIWRSRRSWLVSARERPNWRFIGGRAVSRRHVPDRRAAGRVGLEIEAHCYDPAAPYRRPSWDEITDVVAALPHCPAAVQSASNPAVPSNFPARRWPGAAGDRGDDQRSASAAVRLRRCRAGPGGAGRGPAAPGHAGQPGARYRAMEQFFAASHTGVAGAAMMTSTASIQVNVDAGPQTGWAARVRLAHALGPTMIAIAANSPLLGGRFSGWLSTRQRVWGQLDAARCGPVLAASGDDPGTDWARYALKAR
ncbi:glutamate-cysteine ligase 2 family protein [Mycobacterium xenopi 4042]|uniref:glutamate--cysteine ligase n=1 Tax=Mycobacterium xenopi 4042 TaxID=1299334 RepID=X8EDC8_MYCXE|nr:glutamate-cysteine ligase 2 family protein [Mycobacterium xenopi 4042]